MKYFLLVATQLLLFGCVRATYTGIYYDSCTLYHKPSVSLALAANQEFVYNFLYNDTPVKGTWQRSHDTITLKSSIFLLPKTPLTPVIKYTDNDSVDRFIIAGKRLVPINKFKDTNKGCFLNRQ